MTKISAEGTLFQKWVLAIAWCAALIVMGVDALRARDPMPVPWFLFASVVGTVFMKKILWDLVDDVYDYGDFLLIRKWGKEDRINLSKIVNVNVSTAASWQRITLRLDKPSRFGRKIVYSPISPFFFPQFRRNEIGEDLTVRVNRRSGGSSSR